MLIGRYDQNIDPKGRVNIPSKFRSALGETFVVALGENNYVNIYPTEEWDAFMERVYTLPAEDRMDFMRHIQELSVECGLDSQGRVVIPPQIREAAGLQKEIVVIGEHKKVEVWSLDRWNEYKHKDVDEDKMAKYTKLIGI